MLRQSEADNVCASMMSLPFADNCFDVIVSGLALGHATDMSDWMSEVARVLRPGGTLLYSDFHPAAIDAGLTRSFRAQDGTAVTVPHQCFGVDAQRRGLAEANLKLEVLHEVRVGMDLKEEFPKSDEFYRRWHGLPIVLIVRAYK
jgi:malonyl-CoA O-methyltransferase